MVMRPGISVFTGSPLQDITPEIVNLQQQLNNLSTVLGDLTALPTADKTSLVNSLKEVNNGFGNLSKVVVTLETYGGKGDWNGTTGTDNLTPLTNLINANPSGTRVYLQPGNYYISDENLLPNLIQNFEFVGVYGKSIITFGKVAGVNTYTVPSSSSVPNFIKCTFRNITFSAPNVTIGWGIFTSGSGDLKFEDCIISDVKPQFLGWTNSNVILRRCKFIAPNTPSGTCLMSVGNVPQNFVVEECEFNYAPNQGGGTFIACTNDSRLIGDYWFLNNRFLTDNLAGYYIDAAIDLEPNNGTTALRNVHIEGNDIWNSKIYVGSVEECWIKDNYIRMTSVTANGSVPSGSAIQGTEAYTTAPCKYIEISNNIIILDDILTYNYKHTIFFSETNTIERLVIRDNVLQMNGKMNGSPVSAIYLNGASGTVNYVEIKDNHISYTSIPSVIDGVIKIITQTPGTFNHVRVERNVLAGVAGASTCLLRQENGGGSTTIDEIIIKDNDCRVGAPTTDIITGTTNVINLLIKKDNLMSGTTYSVQSATLISTWVNNNTTYFNSAGYWIDEYGVVHLKGVVSGGTAGSTIFTLPIGYRPTSSQQSPFSVYCQDGTGNPVLGRVDVYSSGNVVFQAGNSNMVSLEGITFRIQ